MKKRTTQLLTPAAVAGCLAMAPALANGSVIFIDDFESPVVTNPAANNNPVGWTILETSGTQIQVTAGSSTNGSGANAQVLDYQGGNGDFTRAEVGFTEQDDVFFASYKVKFGLTANADARLIFDLGRSGDTDLIRLNMRPNATTGFLLALPGTTPDVVIVADIIEEDWYQIDFEVDPNGGSGSVTVTNLDDTSVGQSGTAAITAFAGTVGDGFDNIRFGVTGAATSREFDAQIDDVTVFIPEPASLSLLAIGGMAMLGRRRRR